MPKVIVLCLPNQSHRIAIIELNGFQNYFDSQIAAIVGLFDS